MKVVKSIHLYINSANRQEGSPYDFTVDIPPELDVALSDENQSIQLSLLKLSTYLEYYIITAGISDTIIFTKHNTFGIVTDSLTVVIPQGNYTYANIAQLISNSMCSVSYVSRLNKFLFNFGSSKGGVEFVNTSHRVFGFIDASRKLSQVIGSNHSIYSENALKPRPFDRLHLSLFDVTPIASNYANDSTKFDDNSFLMSGKYFQRSRLIASIPLNNPPFTLLHYEDGATDRINMVLADQRLKKLRFVVTNEFDDPLTALKDSFIILRLEVIEPEDDIAKDQLKILKQMNEWLRIGFIQSNLKQ